MKTDLTMLPVLRKDIILRSKTEVEINKEVFAINTNQYNEIVALGSWNQRNLMQLKAISDEAESMELINRLLHTDTLASQPMSLFIDNEGFIGIDPRFRETTPAGFLDLVKEVSKIPGISIDPIGSQRDMIVTGTFDLPMELIGDIYKPTVTLHYGYSEAVMNLGLFRLVCSNGAITKMRGTSINLEKIGSNKRVIEMITRILTNQYAVYEPVRRLLELAKETSASVDDLEKFDRAFRPHIGEAADWYFRVEQVKSSFPNFPEHAPALWKQTARAGISVFDLYNIGTNVVTHSIAARAAYLPLMIFLGSYLSASKPLAGICDMNADRQVFDNVSLLRGE